MSKDLGSALENAIAKVVIELIETRAVLTELERAFPYIDSNYYYSRKQKLSYRVEQLESILEHSKIGYTKDAPAEQFLVTKY
jgi:hypothetical protein